MWLLLNKLFVSSFYYVKLYYQITIIVFSSLNTAVHKPLLASSAVCESHDEKNLRLKRPMSPHLTVYKFQLPANMSITHRATGIVLATYAMTLGIGKIKKKKRYKVLQEKIFLQSFTRLSTSYHKSEIALIFSGTLIIPGGVPALIAGVDAWCLPIPVLWMCKYFLALPATYHFFNGIRHLVSKIPYSLDY